MKILKYILLIILVVITYSCSNSKSEQTQIYNEKINKAKVLIENDTKPIKAKKLLKNEYYRELYNAGIDIDNIRKLNVLQSQYKRTKKKLRNSDKDNLEAEIRMLNQSHNEEIKSIFGAKDFAIKTGIDKKIRKKK